MVTITTSFDDISKRELTFTIEQLQEGLLAAHLTDAPGNIEMKRREIRRMLCEEWHRRNQKPPNEGE